MSTLYNIEAERAVLGAILSDSNSYFIIAHVITKPEFFFLPEHKVIYTAISKLGSKNSAIDLITVLDVLRGGKELVKPEYLVDLTGTVHNSKNIEYHARILVDFYIRRVVVMASKEIEKKAAQPNIDCFDLVELLNRAVGDAMSTTSKGVMKTTAQLLEGFKENFRNTINNSGIIGLGCGLKEIDELLGGWQRKKMILIGARPGMGKTAIALFLAYRFALLGEPGIFFSCEMPAEEVYARLVSIELQLTGQQVNRGIKRYDENGMEMLSKEDIEYYLSRLDKSPVLNSGLIKIDDTAGLDVNDRLAKVNLEKNKNPLISWIITDYIQLMRDRTCKGNRENELTEISKKSKQMAKDCDIIGIELAQLSRAVEQRGGDKRPQLSDLRESGSLEQDADIVAFLYRPEYYKIEQDEDGNDVTNMTEVIFAKHRGGACKSVWLKSYMSTYTYKDKDHTLYLDIQHQIVKDQKTIMATVEKASQDVFKINNISGEQYF